MSIFRCGESPDGPPAPFPKKDRKDGLKKVRQGLQEILVLLKKKR